MSVVAVLPIKQLANAKQRLRGVLDDEQRRGLFKAMVEDAVSYTHLTLPTTPDV